MLRQGNRLATNTQVQHSWRLAQEANETTAYSSPERQNLTLKACGSSAFALAPMLSPLAGSAVQSASQPFPGILQYILVCWSTQRSVFHPPPVHYFHTMARSVGTLALVGLVVCASLAVCMGRRLRGDSFPVINDRPIVGILALPNSFPQYKNSGRSYFAVRARMRVGTHWKVVITKRLQRV